MGMGTPTSSKQNQKTGNKSNGWAAFVLEEKGKAAGQEKIENDPYPLLLNDDSAFKSYEYAAKRDESFHRSFCSVIRNSLNVPSSINNQKLVDMKVDNDASSAEQKLKDLHAWADISLIQDVITAVNGNVDEASDLLEGMSNTTFERLNEVKSSNNTALSVARDSESLNMGSDLSSSFEDNLKIDNSFQRLTEDSEANILDNATSKVILVEPEWEEDDLYVTQRKNAIQAMRVASQHSRAAKNAFLRGDHLSARYYSLKAQEQWSSAEELNVSAARNILSIRNRLNNRWTLDLHGLHKAEAVQALSEHLCEIENQFNLDKPVKCSTTDEESGKANPCLELLLSPSLEPAECRNKIAPSRMQPRPLQVITGVGNHGHGEATLPASVKFFLHENGYHYDEKRPGVLSVWPKYRRMSKR